MKTICKKIAILIACFIFVLSLNFNPATAQTPFSGTRSVGSGGYYATLTAAIADAAYNGVNGAVVFELTAVYISTSETFPITIGNISGTSSSNTLTIRPQTGATGLSITSANGTATIDLNAAQYVTIDGRPGGSGSFTTGICLSILNTAGTAPAVRLINDARYNNVKYCDLQSNNSTITTATAGGGIVCFGTTSGSNGNDYNSISYCDLHNVTGGNPLMCVFAYGSTATAAANNDSNSVANCNVYNFYNATTATSGINIGAGNNGWYITNNHFYQSAALVYNGVAIHRVINIIAGSGYTVNSNYIGGDNATGTNFYTMGGATSPTTSTHTFIAIEATVGTATVTNINNNTITNIDFTSAFAGSLSIGAINVLGGVVVCNFNTIGSTTMNGAIKVTTNCTTNVGGIICLRSGTGTSNITFNNNVISGIDMYGNATTFTPEFHGINFTQTSTIATANNNVIGSTTLANSINLVSTCASSTYPQRLDGFIINPSSAGTITINNNTIANLNTNYVSTGTQAASVRGIYVVPTSTGTYTVSNNTIRNLTSASQTTGGAINCAVIGIGVSTTTANVSLTGNRINSLVLAGPSTTGAVQCEGIFYSGMSTGTNLINKNFINGLSINAVNPTAYLTGMDVGGGLITLSNNMIRLGYDSNGASVTTPCVIRGISKNVSICNVYFNSVYIGGTGVGAGTSNSFAFQRTAAAVDDVRDNIFVNNRSNASTGGKHYQSYLINSTSLTSNYNLYYGNGNGAVFGSNNNGTTDVTTYAPGWVSGDINSMVNDPQFINATGNASTTDLHISAFIPTVIESGGTTIASVTDDYDGQLRASFTPEDMGADAGNFVINDIVAPLITIPVLLTNTALTGNRSFNATLTDATGIFLSGTYRPRVYFRKSISSTYLSTQGVFVSGTAKNSVWNFTINSTLLGGVNPSDSIYYFVIAQDSVSTSNIGSLPSGATAADVNTVYTYPALGFGYKISIAVSGGYTVGPSGSYASITAAVTDIVSNSVTGPITLELLSNYVSTVETFPITIPKIPNVDATNTITLRPQTGAYGLKITSANATATFDFNGAQYITIDGRPGGSGTRDLAISNTATTGVAIRFINDACFNTLKHDSLIGVNSASAGGVVFFSTTTGTRGNDSNTIDNCDIRDGASTPATAIYSLGTTTVAAQYNSNNAITNCNIYNFWNPALECNAFRIAGGNTDWVMSGNSIFQTATRTATAAFQQYIWNLNNALANNHIITNNYIGGSAPMCGGTAWTATSTVGFRITGAYLNVGAVTPSTFSGNTFANINLTSGGTAYATIPGVFSGPWLVGGLTNVTNNTFGSMTSLNSIVVNSNINNNLVVPIGATGTTAGTINIKNNNFGGINVSGTSAAISSNLYAISITTSNNTTTYTIDSNVIGNDQADNMICSSASTSTTGQQMAGFYCTATSFIKLRYNTIRNFRNNTVGAATTPLNWIHAIEISGNSVDSIIGNTLSNLSIGSAFQNNNSGSAALIGIRAVPATAGNFISKNEIYGLTQNNTGASTVSILGIVTNSMLSTSIIQKNYLHGFNLLSSSPTASIFGINHQGGTAKYINNMVQLGMDSTGNSITGTPLLYGIYKLAGSMNLFFNSVYIGGSGVGSGLTNTFGYYSTAVGLDSILNNIFSNERSNSSTGGTHYGIFLNGNTTLTCNANVFWYSGTGGALGLYGATNATTLGGWSVLSGTDGGSGFANPQFINPTGANATLNLHISNSIPTPVERSGMLLSSFNDDIDGQLRSSLTPTDVGADAGNFILNDVAAPIILHAALNNTAFTTDRTLSANIMDATGLNIVGSNRPRVYYKKFSYGTYTSSQGTLISGTPQNGNWSFVISSALLGGLSLNDSVYYFLVAQDSSFSANLSSLPAGVSASGVNIIITPPNANFSYTIVPGLSGLITVGSGGTYPSLTMAGGAFAAINAASLTGNITLSIVSDLLEDGSNVLNQFNESGAGNYSITISPNTNTLRSIAGTVGANIGLITFNGADRVKIDGRFAGSGMYLAIRNRSTAGSTIRFVNDAHRDTIMYTYLEGLSNTSPGATIWFTSPATGGTGNDSNAIMYCYIQDTLNNPLGGSVQNSAIYSNGAENSENTISYNQVFNYLYQGVNIGTGLTNHDNWVCNGNSFYQGDNARAKTSSGHSQAFYIYSGNNWTISNNSIGGSAPDRSGTAWKATYNTTLALVLKAIELSGGTISASNISGNIISNIQTNPLASTTAAFSGIYVAGGLVNITNNTIGGGVNAYDTIMEGSYNGAGINIVAGTVTISNNTISHISNYSAYASAATRTLGIFVQSGTANITGNSIHDIKSVNTIYGTGPAYTGSNPAGIFIGTASTNAVNIEANQIFNIMNISNSATANTSNGITISGGTCTVHRNRIYNIFGTGTGAGNASPLAYGIFLSTSGHMIRNNQISLGLNSSGESQVFGIQDVSASSTNSMYYNSIFINGRTLSGSNNSYCIQRTSLVNDLVWNNILYNKRSSGGTGYNYALGASNPTGITPASINYNLILVSDTSKLVEFPAATPNGIASFNGLFNPATYNTNWMDLSSAVPAQNLFMDTANGNLGINTTNAASWYVNGKAIALAGITGDYASATSSRSVSIVTGSTDIGSVEFSTATTPANALASASPALNSSTYYKVANRVVSSISWGSTGVVPLSVSVKYYSGTNAPNLIASKTQYNAYVNVAAVGPIGLNYNISLLADSAYFGNVSGTNASRLAYYQGSGWTLKAASSANAASGLLSTTASLPNASLSSNFTGTDASNPLPVNWLNFQAKQLNHDVILNWSTGSEINSLHYVIERSKNQTDWTEAGIRTAKGNTASVSSYTFTDFNAFSDLSNKVLFYRLKQLDLNGDFTYSKILEVLAISKDNTLVSVYPNPFESGIDLSIPGNGIRVVEISVFDIQGRMITSISRTMEMDSPILHIDELNTLNNGVYFLVIKTGSEVQTIKLMKAK